MPMFECPKCGNEVWTGDACLVCRPAKEQAEARRAAAASSVVFAVSNDGGKTGVAWREDVHDALSYLDLQNAGGITDYCVVAVRKSPQNV
jgi:hypothetical protein